MEEQKDFSAAFSIPCLPRTSPLAPTPHEFLLPLRPHQQRALHRCLVLEQDGICRQGFNITYGFTDCVMPYRSRGGVLADAVGMGKTAVAIALIIASAGDGPTLVVAPGHLINQWATEVAKFVGNAMRVISGAAAFAKYDVEQLRNGRSLVLVDVKDVLAAPCYWYDFRRIFSDSSKTARINMSSQQKILYKRAANFCVKSPKGGCSYEGWLYVGGLHMPSVSWRRVIYDEIQDLISEGTNSQENLMQLSRTAQNVWLLSATPFPHGNKSVLANHHLLGFCRVNLDVEIEEPLDYEHPFEIIKRKLYIRSPQAVRDEAILASVPTVRQQVIKVEQSPLERCFYDLELESARQQPGGSGEPGFGQAWRVLREMTVHPAASEELRKATGGRRAGAAISVSSFAKDTLRHADARLSELEGLLPQARLAAKDTELSVRLANAVVAFRASPPSVSLSSWVERSNASMHTFPPACMNKLLHDFFSSPGRPESSANAQTSGQASINARMRRIVSDTGLPEFIHGMEAVRAYIDDELRAPEAMTHYIDVTQRTVAIKQKVAQALEHEQKCLLARGERLRRYIHTQGERAARNHVDILGDLGGKLSALVSHLLANAGQKSIVFSMWHDTLSLVNATLQKCGVACVFCDGDSCSKSAALSAFRNGSADVLLLSAASQASGTNLQIASHVILLDPAGHTAPHGATLEQQAIGRAVRMGQTKEVTVTRFVVTGTLEEHMVAELGIAAAKAAESANNKFYLCEAPEQKVVQSSVKGLQELCGRRLLELAVANPEYGRKVLCQVPELILDQLVSQNGAWAQHVLDQYRGVETARACEGELATPGQAKKRKMVHDHVESSDGAIVTILG